MTRRFSLCFVAALFLVAQALGQLTLQQHKNNNTAACGGTNPPSYCANTFPTMTDTQSGQDGPMLTPNYNFGYVTGVEMGNVSGPASGNVAPLPANTMMPYTDPNVVLFVHFQPWFDTTVSQHPNVGYNSNDDLTVTGQLTDIQARGFGGLIIDWYGQPVANAQCPHGLCFGTEDGTTSKVSSHIADTSLMFAIMEDQGSWRQLPQSAGGCEGTATNQAICIQTRIQNDLTFADVPYFGNTQYYKRSSDGRPYLFTFIDMDDSSVAGCTALTPCNTLSNQPCTNGPSCWLLIWGGSNGVTHFIDTHLTNKPVLIFKDNPSNSAAGFNPDYSAGSIGWIHPNECTPGQGGIYQRTQKDWTHKDNGGLAGGCQGMDASGGNYLAGYYTAAKNAITGMRHQLGVAVVYKGFDSVWRGVPGSHVTTQSCGEVWKTLMSSPSTFGSTWDFFGRSGLFTSDVPIPAVQVVTWNDYEEGTEIETGIDNCLNDNFNASRVGDVLSWNPVFSDFNTTDHELNTVDHYDILDADANDPLQTVVPIGSAPSGTHQFNVFGLTGCDNRNLYVKAQGVPSVLNRMSVAVSYTGPPCPTVARMSATTVAWGNQRLATNSTVQTIRVTNAGVALLNISKVSLAGDFRIVSNNCPRTLAANLSCDINVYFRPTRTGLRTGALALLDNAIHSPQTVGLSGTGIR